MLIPNPDPITIPETYAQTFDSYWVSRINLTIKSPTDAHGVVTLQPYDSINEDILPGHDRAVYIGNLWEKAAQIPQVASAIQGLIDAVIAIDKYDAAQKLAAEQALAKAVSENQDPVKSDR